MPSDKSIMTATGLHSHFHQPGNHLAYVPSPEQVQAHLPMASALLATSGERFVIKATESSLTGNSASEGTVGSLGFPGGVVPPASTASTAAAGAAGAAAATEDDVTLLEVRLMAWASEDEDTRLLRRCRNFSLGGGCCTCSGKLLSQTALMDCSS